MPDNRTIGREGMSPRRENICIDSYRILDSCKDKDCFEDTRVLLTDYGQEILEKSGSVRVTGTHVIWTDIVVDPVKFNRGFYQISIRYFTKITCEACVGLGKSQEIEGIAVNEKKVVLYGGEGNVNIFRSSELPGEFCTWGGGGETVSSSKPSVVVEVVDPIALSVKVKEKGSAPALCCCCCAEEMPSCVVHSMNGNLCDPAGATRNLYVTLGFFSVIRLERPAQFLVSATEYAVPDKVCCKAEEEDPCAIFAKMSFPVNEFFSGGTNNGCGSCG
ncbi:MAG: hypothetical protein IJX76_03795 [Clostridia bacterium]|nr:hypothetical protein [Clostridia bacterium]